MLAYAAKPVLADALFYGPTSPPVAPYTWPVTKLASLDASSTYIGATSAGCPGQPSGVSSPKSARLFGNWPPLGCNAVQNGPGATAASCFARHLLKLRRRPCSPGSPEDAAKDRRRRSSSY